MKRNIIIVDAGSTGSHFANDITDRGYHPVVLNPPIPSCAVESIRSMKNARRNITCECDFINATTNYEENLELVKKFNPIAIIAGRDSGVALTNKLCKDLSLRGNPVECSDAMTKKSAMHEALKQAGVRYIKGKIVKNSKEAENFLRDNGLSCAVVKPTFGASSTGVVLADNIEEVISAVNKSIGEINFWGETNDSVLVQERIFGTEYIVNTVSRNGIHRVTSLLVYKKVRTDEGAYVYIFTEAISTLRPGMNRLVKYALKVLDAIGIKNGACHGEYMIDNKGPILVEVNCRPMGMAIKKNYLDTIFGHHETDAVLDAYLDEKKFMADLKKPYNPKAKGYIKFIRVPKDMKAKSLPILPILKMLETVTEVRVRSVSEKSFYKKTFDMHSDGGAIFLMSKDENKVNYEHHFLCFLENYFFNLLISDGSFKCKIDKDIKLSSEYIYDAADCRGSCLVLSDNFDNINNVIFKKPEDVYMVDDKFDNVILNFSDCLTSYTDQEIVDLLIKCFSRVKPYGRAVVAPLTYKSIIYSYNTIEILMNLCGISLDLPYVGDLDLIIGTKNYRKFDNIVGWHASYLPPHNN